MQKWRQILARGARGEDQPALAHAGRAFLPGSHTTELLNDDQLIEIVRWHILRADSQRAGLWTRATAVLSADALVIAGTAVLVSAGDSATWWSLLTAALPLIAAMISVWTACNIVGGISGWQDTFKAKDSPTPLFYSLPDTVKGLGTYEKFRHALSNRSAASELDDAASEFWRLSVLHLQRLHQLRRSIHWLQISLPLLFISIAVIISSLPTK
jgi:hypothetical protein